MGWCGYIRFAGPAVSNLLKRLVVNTTADFYVRCLQRIRRKLGPRYSCPCDLRAVDPQQKEETEFVPPLPPFHRKVSSHRSVLGSHSSIETISAANLDPTGPSCSTCSLSTIFPLGSQPWFFDIGRREAASYLKNTSNGTFLVRPSKHGGVDNLYTLSLQFKNRVYHILIRKRNDGLFALGSQREGEEAFPSVETLVEYHKTERLKLTAGSLKNGTTSLVQWPRGSAKKEN